MTQQTIVEAIQKKKVLNLGYGGVIRKIIPHTYGKDKDGSVKLRGYQIVGDSVDNPTGWRMFNETNIESLSLSNETFEGPIDGYKRDDKALTSIIAQL